MCRASFVHLDAMNACGAEEKCHLTEPEHLVLYEPDGLESIRLVEKPGSNELGPKAVVSEAFWSGRKDA